MIFQEAMIAAVITVEISPVVSTGGCVIATMVSPEMEKHVKVMKLFVSFFLHVTFMRNLIRSSTY